MDDAGILSQQLFDQLQHKGRVRREALDVIYMFIETVLLEHGLSSPIEQSVTVKILQSHSAEPTEIICGLPIYLSDFEPASTRPREIQDVRDVWCDRMRRFLNLRTKEEREVETKLAKRIPFKEERLLCLRFIEVRNNMPVEHGATDPGWASFVQQVTKNYRVGSCLLADAVRATLKAERAYTQKASGAKALREYKAAWTNMCSIADAVISPQDQGRNAYLSGQTKELCPYSSDSLVVDAHVARGVWLDAWEREEELDVEETSE